MVSSHQTRDLERFEDRSGIPWNLPTNFHPDLIATIAEVPSLILRTALSAIPLVSDLCGVDVQMIPGKIFTSFAEFQGIVSVNDFWFPFGFQELLQAALGFL